MVVGDVEGDGQHAVAVAGEEVVELLGWAGGRDELVTSLECRLDDRAARTA
ncbi:hypothetical protein ABZ835_44465 [Streptomyces sp. NPDC047461]|uniref:hypothetical protein n=1 Tax=Streptomyces sp. NPDC047461 TaxID=3155619 RepID=UPI0034092F7C